MLTECRLAHWKLNRNFESQVTANNIYGDCVA